MGLTGSPQPSLRPSKGIPLSNPRPADGGGWAAAAPPAPLEGERAGPSRKPRIQAPYAHADGPLSVG
ncbi:hypothetical protein Slala02_21280 [Streptomyces lavendulae subsp. lavendulae]|nr:hypothetical protein Slala01_16080 [Streptomyces lavendulae subsp. lavendulae]GLX26308.1 hypothetical protein Slala02_21280 [Streptomyces lavendulae subsp. lavendulae]